MGAMASQITSLTIVYSNVYLGISSASLAFVRGIRRSPVNSPHKWPVMRKMFPFDDVIMSFTYHIEKFGKVVVVVVYDDAYGGGDCDDNISLFIPYTGNCTCLIKHWYALQNNPFQDITFIWNQLESIDKTREAQ